MIPLFLFSTIQKPTSQNEKSSGEFEINTPSENNTGEKNICEKIEDWIQTKILSENNIVDKSDIS